MSRERTIFKRGSTTFFFSSLFFPAEIKKDVFELYSFVRVADDYVDTVPADKTGFRRLRRQWAEAVADPDFDTTRQAADNTDELVVKNMLRVARKHKFDLDWIETFLAAMESDLTHRPYETLKETFAYMHGSAETVGLMMARVMGLEPAATDTAMLQGRALQYMNFIRDVEEDNSLGRRYFPAADLQRFNLPDLSRKTARAQPADFTEFIRCQLGRYKKWQTEANAGYKYIPKRLRIPIQTAAAMYAWTGREIYKNPLAVYDKKIKPSKLRVTAHLLTKIV